MIQRLEKSISVVSQSFCPDFKCESVALILRDVVPD